MRIGSKNGNRGCGNIFPRCTLFFLPSLIQSTCVYAQILIISNSQAQKREKLFTMAGKGTRARGRGRGKALAPKTREMRKRKDGNGSRA
jgi:hypothetical protein